MVLGRIRKIAGLGARLWSHCGSGVVWKLSSLEFSCL